MSYGLLLAFSPAYPSFPFVPKGVMDSKGCPTDSFDTLPLVMLVHPITFNPKRIMETKVCPPLTLPLVLLVHHFPLSLND